MIRKTQIKIESRLGSKGLYISGCIDQDHLQAIDSMQKQLHQEENMHFHLSLFNVEVNKDLFAYATGMFHDAILEYFNESGKDILDYLGSDVYKINSWKTDINLPEHLDTIQYGDLEQSSGPRPSINVLAYLTEDYEDGEIFFSEVGVSIRPKAGSVVIFDSDLMHGVNAVKSGERRTMSSNLYNIHSEDIEEFKTNGFRDL